VVGKEQWYGGSILPLDASKEQQNMITERKRQNALALKLLQLDVTEANSLKLFS